VYKKPRPHQKTNEVKIHGRNAALALFRFRSKDIIRVYVHENETETYSELLKWCAKNRKAYHQVKDKDLEKLSGAMHHQGICILAKEKSSLTLRTLQQELPFHHEPALLVFLDGVGNPHNIGAILRNCAHFGVKYILGTRGKFLGLSPSAHRISEGGAESVSIVKFDDEIAALSDLKKLGFSIVVADFKKDAKSLHKFSFPKRSILVLGAEVEGVSPELHSIADAIVHIPGSGTVESMNVSAVSAVFFNEYVRQTQI